MARWRLMQAHYLNVPGTEWEYKETSRDTGKQVRRVFNVPLYLNPEDPADWNYPQEIIVSDGKDAQRKDIIFVGPPTPDMEPVDEAAEVISKSESHKWIHPIESLSGNYSQSLLDGFQRQIADLQAGLAAKPANPVSAGAIDPTKFAELQAQVAALMASNAELQAQLAEPKVARRG